MLAPAARTGCAACPRLRLDRAGPPRGGGPGLLGVGCARLEPRPCSFFCLHLFHRMMLLSSQVRLSPCFASRVWCGGSPSLHHTGPTFLTGLVFASHPLLAACSACSMFIHLCQITISRVECGVGGTGEPASFRAQRGWLCRPFRACTVSACTILVPCSSSWRALR